MGRTVHRRLKFAANQATRSGVHSKVPPARFAPDLTFIDADNISCSGIYPAAKTGLFRN